MQNVFSSFLRTNFRVKYVKIKIKKKKKKNYWLPCDVTAFRSGRRTSKNIHTRRELKVKIVLIFRLVFRIIFHFCITNRTDQYVWLKHLPNISLSATLQRLFYACVSTKYTPNLTDVAMFTKDATIQLLKADRNIFTGCSYTSIFISYNMSAPIICVDYCSSAYRFLKI